MRRGRNKNGESHGTAAAASRDPRVVPRCDKKKIYVWQTRAQVPSLFLTPALIRDKLKTGKESRAVVGVVGNPQGYM